MSDWLAPIFGMIGVIVGVGISEFRRWRESKDRYRVLTFEKRLKTHQEALYHCTQIAILCDPDKLKNNGIDDFLCCISDASDWQSHNCLYLDTKSSEMMLISLGGLVQWWLTPLFKGCIFGAWKIIFDGASFLHCRVLPSKLSARGLACLE